MSRIKLKLNPAFAKAHSLTEAADGTDPFDKLEKELSNANSTSTKLAKAIEDARKSGKLTLNSIGLTLPLPKAMFDIRADLVDAYDGTAAVDDSERFWECHGEETLTLLDMSNNDLSINIMSTTTDVSDKLPKIMIDDRLQCYKSLNTMVLRNCNLDALPWEVFGNFESLRVLDLQGNNIESIPLHSLPQSMNNLLLAKNRISSLGSADSHEAVELPELRQLDLSDNALCSLPSTLECGKMQHLILARNMIESISPTFLFSSRNMLRTIDMANNRLTSDMDLSPMKELQFLDLRYNKLTNIPKIHKNLSRLDVSFNKISEIDGMYEGQYDEEGKTDDGKWFRSKLSELHLQKNALKKLDPSTMATMTNLSILDIRQNSLENMPHCLGYLIELHKVLIDGNPLRMIRNAIIYKSDGGIEVPKILSSLRNKGDPPMGPGYYGAKFESEQLNVTYPKNVAEAKDIAWNASCNKRVLDIGGRGLSGELDWHELVDALMEETTNKSGNEKVTFGSKVHGWKLSHGKLSSFGKEWIKALPNITTFQADGNHIENLPPNFSEFHLKVLEVARNRIPSSMLQDRICISGSNLASTLVNLDLSCNRIEWVPGSLFDLHQLQSLNLSHNKIKSLEWDDEEERGWRHGLLSLCNLDLSNNKINDLGYLPLALSCCKNLRNLQLNNNAIYRIPLELGLLEQLTNIDLLGNSQRQIRVRVLTQPCSQILKYLRDRLTPEELVEARENHNEILMDLEDQGVIEESEVDDAVDVEGERMEVAVHKDTNGYKQEREYEGALSQIKVDKNTSAGTRTGKGKGTGTGRKINVEVKAQAQEIKSTYQDQDQHKNHNESAAMMETFQRNILDLSQQLENLSLSQARRYALKRSLAMERSKLTREERKLESERDM